MCCLVSSTATLWVLQQLVVMSMLTTAQQVCLPLRLALRPPELPHLEVKGPLEVAQAQAEQRQVCSAETSGSWLCCCNAIIPVFLGASLCV